MKLVLVQPALDYDTAEQNLTRLRRAVEDTGAALAADDVVLLPEHWDPDTDGAAHRRRVAELARALGCHVVGGSHHEQRPAGRVNTGHVCGPDGAVLASYEKLRPYATERALVTPGERLGEVVIAGRRTLVLVCADFWFSDLIDRAASLPDLVLVPALSVTRKPTPSYSRSLWRHLAVARAYELGTFVGVSDWSHASTLPMMRASGVGGLADPTVTEPEAFFSPIGASARVYDLDFDALSAFRNDRRERGFFWR